MQLFFTLLFYLFTAINLNAAVGDRSIQLGPLGLVDGPSVYGYAGQNPVMKSDPMGLFSMAGSLAGAGEAMAGANVAWGIDPVSAAHNQLEIQRIHYEMMNGTGCGNPFVVAQDYLMIAGAGLGGAATGAIVGKGISKWARSASVKKFIKSERGSVPVPFSGRKDGAKNRRVQIDESKFDYLFGRVTSNPHNTARSQQLQSELGRIGIWDTPNGRQTLISQFDDVAADPSNVLRTYTETRNGVTQTFQVRESLLAGPGGFVRLVSTFETMADGTLRFITTIPFR